MSTLFADSPEMKPPRNETAEGSAPATENSVVLLSSDVPAELLRAFPLRLPAELMQRPPAPLPLPFGFAADPT